MPILLKLTKDQISYVATFKHVFLEVQHRTAVPWQVLAAIWVRESFSVSPPRTKGGPFQFDPPPEHEFMESLLVKYVLYTHAITGQEVEDAMKKGINDFETAALFAACFLKNKMKGGEIKTDDQIKKAMWLYNGASGTDPTHSAYVYNGFDACHIGMRIRGTIPGKNGKRIKIDVIDKRPGTFVTYLQLISEKV